MRIFAIIHYQPYWDEHETQNIDLFAHRLWERRLLPFTVFGYLRPPYSLESL